MSIDPLGKIIPEMPCSRSWFGEVTRNTPHQPEDGHRFPKSNAKGTLIVAGLAWDMIGHMRCRCCVPSRDAWIPQDLFSSI